MQSAVLTESSIPLEAMAKLYASNARAVILRMFLLDPLRSYYQRQIEGATDLPIRAVQREVERLSSIGLLYRREEGNRAYYQVNTLFPFYPELRSMVLKSCSPVDRLRGQLAVRDDIRLVFWCEGKNRVLVVVQGESDIEFAEPSCYAITAMPCEEFERALAAGAKEIKLFLERGVDLLGRRDGVIWRRIEAAGYTVRKGKGVA